MASTPEKAPGHVTGTINDEIVPVTEEAMPVSS
jgi:hypothetical protein